MIYAGVDIGGTTVKVGLIDEKGHILAERALNTKEQSGPQVMMQKTGELIFSLLTEIGREETELKAIGMGSPGKVNPETGMIVYAANIAGFDRIPVTSWIQEWLREHHPAVSHIPVVLENDANVATLGEAWLGAGRGSQDVITVTIGTGLGGGAMINGKLFSGSHFGGGELGHHVINAEGPLCSCGRRGCWELYSSATALVRHASELAREKKGAIGISYANAKEIFDAAEAGDEIARETLDWFAHYLGVGIGNLINMFEPEYVIIGGGPSAQGDKLLQPVLREVKKEIIGDFACTQVVMAELGNKAGIIGAAALGRSAAESERCWNDD